MMRKIIIIIGTLVFVALMYSVPIILACSFFLKMDGFLKIIIIICSAAQLAMLVEYILFKIIGKESEK